jgi:hypothetical protein
MFAQHRSWIVMCLVRTAVVRTYVVAPEMSEHV